MTLGSLAKNTALFFLFLVTGHGSHLNVVDEDLPEAVGEHVLGGLGGTVTDVWHQIHALETATHSVVNTLGLAPIPADLVVPITLVPGELLRPLFDDLRLGGWCDSHGDPSREKIGFRTESSGLESSTELAADATMTGG